MELMCNLHETWEADLLSGLQFFRAGVETLTFQLSLLDTCTSQILNRTTMVWTVLRWSAFTHRIRGRHAAANHMQVLQTRTLQYWYRR